ARASGRLVCCDLDEHTRFADELLPLLDACIVSPSFLAGYTGEDALRPELVEALARRTASGFACVTLGEAGCAALDGRAHLRPPAFRVHPLVDTTACGDTFRAGFVAAHLDGRDVRACLRFAAAAAGLKVRDLGRLGCPTRAQVDDLLLDHA